jgi:hypothetical protein
MLFIIMITFSNLYNKIYLGGEDSIVNSIESE